RCGRGTPAPRRWGWPRRRGSAHRGHRWSAPRASHSSRHSFLDNARHAEEVPGGLGRIGQHVGPGQRWARLVLSHHVGEGHRVGGGLHPGGVHRAELVDVGEDMAQLVLHANQLRLGKLEPRQARHVLDVLARDPELGHDSISSRWAYWRERRLRPTLAKWTVAITSSPSRWIPTRRPSPPRAWRSRAPTWKGRSSSTSAGAGAAGTAGMRGALARPLRSTTSSSGISSKKREGSP